MKRRRKIIASRTGTGRGLALWTGLALLGAATGALIGSLAIGGGFHSRGDQVPSFAALSANPEALAADAGAAAPIGCADCADSYGAAARLRAERASAMDPAFRKLGDVDVDLAPPSEPDDGYRYGGRFPDTPPSVSPPSLVAATAATAAGVAEPDDSEAPDAPE